MVQDLMVHDNMVLDHKSRPKLYTSVERNWEGFNFSKLSFKFKENANTPQNDLFWTDSVDCRNRNYFLILKMI